MIMLALTDRSTPQATAHDAEPRRIAEQAAEWLEKLAEAKDEERAAFVGWLQSSSTHVSEFLKMCALTEELRRLGQERAISKTDPAALFGQVTYFFSLHSKRVDEKERRLQEIWKKSTAKVARCPRSHVFVSTPYVSDCLKEPDHLYLRYRGPLLKVFLQRRIDRDAAQDLLQRTFLQALKKIRTEGLSDPENLGGYLYRTACTLANQYRRSELSRAREGDQDVLLEIKDDTVSIEEKLDVEKRAKSVRELMRRLPAPRDREILDRFYLREESRTAIRESLQLTELQFNRVLWRARQRFAEILRKDGWASESAACDIAARYRGARVRP